MEPTDDEAKAAEETRLAGWEMVPDDEDLDDEVSYEGYLDREHPGWDDGWEDSHGDEYGK